MRLVARPLALAGLALWLTVQSTFGLESHGLDREREQILHRVQAGRHADLAAPQEATQGARPSGKSPEPPVSPKRVARQDPWRLRFVHAGDHAPLHDIDVRIADKEQTVGTEADGSCTFPRLPAISTDLWIDLDGDGIHTFEIIQSPENATRYPAT